MGPLPAARRAVPQPTSASREAVLRVLRERPGGVTLTELVAACGLAPTTVRGHLAHLVRDGRATRSARPSAGPGRPAWEYAGADRHALGVAEYAGLASALAATIARTSADPGADAVDAGRRWGAQLHAERVAAGGPRQGPAATVVAMLRDFGFAPRVRAGDPEVRLTRCPLLETARAYPQVVCSVHLGLVAGVLDALGAGGGELALAAFAEPGACTLRLAGGPSLPDPTD